MKVRNVIAVALLIGLLTSTAAAQVAPPVPPAKGPGPLLYVQFFGAPGSRITFYQGQTPGREFEMPVTVGMRPGYIYRVKMTGFIEGAKNVALYPTLEVRNTLALPPSMPVSRFPAPVVLHADEVERIENGAYLTKVVYLENPDTAIPRGSAKEEPIESFAAGTGDPVEEARLLGRPVLIVRVGAKEIDTRDLQRQSVPGTILFPDEKALAWPSQPPCFAWKGLPMYDPILGPKFPEEECLHDGGDLGRPAGFDNEGKLHGLDPSDSVAEYKDSHGRKRLTISNKVCVCVPRFAVLNSETRLEGNQVALVLTGAETVRGQALLAAKALYRQTQQQEKLAGVKSRRSLSGTVGNQVLGKLINVQVLNAIHIYEGPFALVGAIKPYELDQALRTRLLRQIEFAREITKKYGTNVVYQVENTQVIGRVEGLALISAVAETRDITVPCDHAPEIPEQPLYLYKWADKGAAEVGDIITFTLKYSNIGGKPITEVAVNDSLAGRLEYVPDSAQSSRDAVFTTEKNEAGSVILRWEVSGKLLPGQSGVVRFQAKVR
jgi:uncharacterized repeat protein (TIGR01451 family)